jgi:hypothetical protein
MWVYPCLVEFIDIRRYCPRIVGMTKEGAGQQCLMPLDAQGICELHGSAFERCVNCRREYLYPHICRTHSLCGLCHPKEGD